MLNEFLVLGQIPGTSFQITFDEYLVLLPVAALLFYAHGRGVSRADLARHGRYIKLLLTTHRGSQLKLPV